MNINFEYYKIFYNVAKNKNITKTANDLLLSQPAISKSIKNLEEQIGCTLFVRGKSGVSLTEEGLMLYNEIKNAVEIIDNAEKKIDEMINLETGILNIGVSNTLTQQYLLSYIKSFNSAYPNIMIKIHTEPTFELIAKARNGLVDFIILNLPYNIPTDFDIYNLKEINDGFVASNEFSFLKNKIIKLEELNNYPLILLARGSNGRFFLDNICSNNKINLVPKFELASYSLVTEFVKSGIGIGFLTKDFIKEELDNGSLFEIKVDTEIEKRHIGVSYIKNKPLNRCSRMFLEYLNKDI